MGGTTTPLAFPYPTGTDRVADGDNAIQALAEKVDDYFVGTSAVVALNPGFDSVGNGLYVVRRGAMVYLNVQLHCNTTVGPGYSFAFIPAAYLPFQNVVFPAFTQDKTLHWLNVAVANGGLYDGADSYGPGAYITGQTAYPIKF